MGGQAGGVAPGFASDGRGSKNRAGAKTYRSGHGRHGEDAHCPDRHQPGLQEVRVVRQCPHHGILRCGSGEPGSGARTIDSIFHTNRDSASEDLAGDQLDNLANLLKHVELLVVDEVSTFGAASFEIVSRRMQQVARVLWRRRFRCPPPEDMGPFGSIGVVLMGDFAQLPPVLATSLLPGVPRVHAGGPSVRAMALAGQKTFTEFEDVLRLRRIHRQKGVVIVVGGVWWVVVRL